MKRYLVGALCGAITFGITYALLIIGVEGLRGRAIRLRSLADLVFALSVINLLVLVAMLGPILLVIRRSSTGGAQGWWRSALITTFLAPVGFFTTWLMFRESNETIAGLFSYIHNVPGEFAINLIPNIASAALFSTWVLSAAKLRRPKALSLEPKA